MIPKKVFYVWGAEEPKNKEVQICISTWYQNLKDFEIVEINEKSIEYFNFQKELKENKWFREVYKRKMWAYVSDYIRIKTLYDNGGIYLDTDVTVLQTLEPLLNEPAFVGVQDPGRCEPAILGAQKGNLFLKKILNFYNEEIWHNDLYKIPDIFKYFLEREYEPQNYHYENNDDKPKRYQDITILPKRYLIPFNGIEEYNFEKIYVDTYTNHWYKGSWVKPEIVYFLNNKNKIELDKIDLYYLKECKQLAKVGQIEKLQNVFSVKNEYRNGIKRKVIRILGLKMSFKLKRIKPLYKSTIKKLLKYQNKNNELICHNKELKTTEKILHYSTYKIRCGIAQFLDDYIEGLKNSGYNYNAVLPVNYEYLKDKELIFNYLNKFIEYSKNFDTIVIQHEYGFWNVEDFDIDNKKVDSKLFKNSFGLNMHIYGLMLLDYLIDNLTKLNKKIIIIWHSDFQDIFSTLNKIELENFNYKTAPFFRFFDNQLIKIFIMCQGMRNSLEKRNIPTTIVEYLPHPIKFTKTKIEKKKSDKIVLGSFGYLFQRKGFINILEILKLLPQNYEYIHVGGLHPKQNSSILETFMKNIEERNLQSRVNITGFVENKDLPLYLSKIDLGLYFILNDANYASGAINQFLVNEIPVLTSRGSSFLDLSEFYDCIEFIDDPYDYQTIANKIQMLVNNPQRLEQLQLNSQKFCKENTFEKFAQNIMNDAIIETRK